MDGQENRKETGPLNLRSTDKKDTPNTLAVEIDRAGELVRPVVNLIQWQGRQGFGIVILSVSSVAQVGVLTTLLWLATMQSTFHLTLIWYQVIASVALVLNVLGIPLGFWFLFRRTK